MDIVELTEKAVGLAAKDEKLKEKIKDTTCSIVMALKNGDDTYLTFSINNGELKLLKEKPEDPDFMFEISKEDFTKLMTGKAHGMILMATKKLNMVKGSWAEINKIAGPLGAIPKIGKEIAEKEGM
ncbi:MAG: SCP2 sterol-binding domain-containing protein [Candidatus Thermoplasmatota archaeon]|nr:SCP2 sterol-binding domain-containing protein [Candidatus Thermoplasmatota archaeon]MCG2826722.1 SCP2 sterol-binding domain-containing protein [Thermoplasmatales archaeon]